jgi:hypothetical protein
MKNKLKCEFEIRRCHVRKLRWREKRERNIWNHPHTLYEGGRVSNMHTLTTFFFNILYLVKD